MSTEMEITQLRAAMTAIEAQRPLLGDAVVDAAIAPMREKLAALEAQARPVQQRKQATVLFADVSGFTALSEMMDAEEVAGVMNDLWAVVDRAITDNGGHIDKHIGDAVMALWGADTAREDDPEMAVRAGLAMQAAVDIFCETNSAPLALRIGVNTGPVVLGGMGTTGELTAMGDAVNLASRLEHAAPVGHVLISHDTYRHVRGIFDVTAREPLIVKGKAGPVQTYVIQRAKPRAFHLGTRGVEGVETRMIGRDAELLALENAYVAAAEAGETQVAIIIGEAGVGKSRLLYEFENWLELRPEQIRYFKGRSIPNTQHVPFSLFRDLFAFRFDIRDNDSATVALEKFRAGVDGFLEPERADIVGHWLGFDFSASPAVTNLLNSTEFGTVARAHLTQYFRSLVATRPVIVFLEDIHWADDASLDLATHLASAIPQARLLLLALARPSLFERRPSWGEGQAAFRRIMLAPLSRYASRALVDEILRHVVNLPDVLGELIVDTAEGNPFYVEELVKMLIDQGVIKRGDHRTEPEFPGSNPVSTAGDVWRVQNEKLGGLQVPATLTGLLQARLDGLPQPERETLQRASVVGRLFWADAVAELMDGGRAGLADTLESVRNRELIFRRERSSFTGVDEYIFKHALLRDVTYETVLLKYRAEFHGKVARWLEEHASERIGEYLGLIAEHYTQAGEFDRAAAYQHRSGEQALRTSAFRAAREGFERALALRKESGALSIESLPHYLKLGEATLRLSDFPAVEQAMRRALELARQSGDLRAQAEALSRLAPAASSVGRTEEAGRLLEEALGLARQSGGQTLASVLIALATQEWQNGNLDAAEQHAAEARQIGRDTGDIALETGATQTLGIIAGLGRDFEGSLRYFDLCLTLARQAGNRYQESIIESNIGATKQYAGDFNGAIVHYLASLEAGEEMGMIDRMAINAHNLADVYATLGELDAGRRYVRECVRLAQQVGAVPLQLAAMVPLADVLVKQGETGRALALLGLARAHPGTPQQKQTGIAEVLAAVEWDEQRVDAALASGAALDFDTVVQEILDGKW
ncbi:MAG: AAA family ATPase [Candidatus Promineofilum sp.]|nr:AAA family ATPase [Promineifilum sp.]